MIGRRGFMRKAGVAAAVAPMAGPALAEGLSTLPMGPMGGTIVGYPTVGRGILSHTAHALFNEHQERRQRRSRYCHGVDLDILAVKSTRDWFKLSVQIKRDQERESFLEKLKREAFGE